MFHEAKCAEEKSIPGSKVCSGVKFVLKSKVCQGVKYVEEQSEL